MATLHPDFSAFLSSLKSSRVRFLIVGAHALAAHGVQRWTSDINIFIEPSRENAERLADVLRDFGWARLADAAPEHFSEPDRMARLGRSPVQIDPLTGISGLTFEEAWSGRSSVELGGAAYDVLGLAEYVKTKKAAGRSKDQLDLQLLRDAGLLEEE